MDQRDYVRRFLELAGATDFRPSAEGWVCRCPFHDGPTGRHRSKNPSFSVNAKTGAFLCFSGVCGKRGSLTHLLMERCGLPFSKVRDMVGDIFQPQMIDVPTLPTYEGRNKKSSPQDRMESLPVEILGAYDRCPVYMLERGFDKTVLRQWDIGFDEHRRKVTIPVWLADRRLVGITKRAVDPWIEPRYQHLYFEKALVLYGEHLVSDVTEKDPLVVVESQMSVMWLHQAGVRNAVSTLGSQVSATQVSRISKYPYVILAFDEDEAGRNATHRVLHGRFKQMRQRHHGEVEIHEPGIIHTMSRGRVRVVTTYDVEGMKDFQEIPLDRVRGVLDNAPRWEEAVLS